MNGYELGAIGERRFDLDVGYHFGNAVHNLVAFQHSTAVRQQVANAPLNTDPSEATSVT